MWCPGVSRCLSCACRGCPAALACFTDPKFVWCLCSWFSAAANASMTTLRDRYVLVWNQLPPEEPGALVACS